VPLVFLQNSGLGNAVNPLMSLAHPKVYGLPMLMLIGWRGAPGHKDEPQHNVQGAQTQNLLEAMQIPFHVIPNDPLQIMKVVAAALKEAKVGTQAVALLVEPKLFPAKTEVPERATFTRHDALEVLCDVLGDTPIVSTAGFLSRELYFLREDRAEGHGRDFLTVGSMGHALAIAQGIARARPGPVACFDGDGASLMHLGTSALSASSPNLLHVLVNNGCHDSVGGQATPTGAVDFAAVMRAVGYSARSVASAEELRVAAQALDASRPTFIEVKVGRGTREPLGRPAVSTHDCKHRFMQHLKC